jgi:hypothetical protein
MYYYTLQDFLFSTACQIALVGLVTFYLYAIGVSFIKQYEHMKERNYMLAQMLQAAELQTGTPYYSSIAADATGFEDNRSFFRALQNRIKYPQQAPAGTEGDPDM